MLTHILKKSLLFFTKSYFHSCFDEARVFMETSSKKAFKPEAVLTGVQGPWAWILLLLWPPVPENAPLFTSQHRGMDIWLFTHSCLGDTVSVQLPQNTPLAGIFLFSSQSYPLRLSEYSAVFYKKLFYNKTYHDSEGFSTNSVCIRCKIWVVKKLPAVAAVTLRVYAILRLS